MKLKIIYERYFYQFLLDPETIEEHDALLNAALNSSKALTEAIEKAIEKEYERKEK